MASVSALNPKAEVSRRSAAVAINVSAAKSLQDVLKTNLGPKGTLKMLVSGGGEVKLTKDGCVLLKEMSINHPTAAMIARAATAQDEITGDGTTSTVLYIGEMLKQAERFLAEGVHPRVLSDGFEIAREECHRFLNTMKMDGEISRETLVNVARTALRTKVYQELADQLAEICVDAVNIIKPTDPEDQIDLHMVEIMHMAHKMDTDTRLVRGLVLDHGSRHPDMPHELRNCYIFTANASLEYEKTEVNSGFFYSSAEQRERMVTAERAAVDHQVQKVLDLKRKVCDGTDKTFVIINQKGIDAPALEMLAKDGIIALRRAKRRNMERLTLACGGIAVNHLDGLTEEVLGEAGHVYEQVLGDEKFTFVEDVKNPHSCTILIKGPTQSWINQIKDAVRDGLRAVKNVIEDQCVIPGAGAFQIAASAHLMEFAKSVSGRQKLGVEAFAKGLLVIPKVLATNAGLDGLDVMLKVQEEQQSGVNVGVDVESGEAIIAEDMGILDSFSVIRQSVQSAADIASQILLVDEIMKAGRIKRSA